MESKIIEEYTPLQRSCPLHWSFVIAISEDRLKTTNIRRTLAARENVEARQNNEM